MRSNHTSLLSVITVSLFLGCNPPPPQTPRPAAAPSQTSEAPQSRRPPRGRPSATSQPGVFDYYLLNLSWSPEFCTTHPTSTECAAHPGFVVHGLWPQNNDATYPEDCSDAPGPANPQSDTDLMPTVSLVQHEWQTHGTCSGLAADPYFNTVRQAFHQITIPPGFINVSSSSTQTPQAILQQFAAANPSIPASAFALSCGNNYLTAIEVCLTKSLTGEPCPNLRSCAATSVKVTPQ